MNEPKITDIEHFLGCKTVAVLTTNLHVSGGGAFGCLACIFMMWESNINASIPEIMSTLKSFNPELRWQANADGIVHNYIPIL